MMAWPRVNHVARPRMMRNCSPHVVSGRRSKKRRMPVIFLIDRMTRDRRLRDAANLAACVQVTRSALRRPARWVQVGSGSRRLPAANQSTRSGVSRVGPMGPTTRTCERGASTAQ